MPAFQRLASNRDDPIFAVEIQQHRLVGRCAMDDGKRLGEGGAKDRRSSLRDGDDDPALRHESRQAVLNQGSATPEDYPDRGVSTPAAPDGDR